MRVNDDHPFINTEAQIAAPQTSTSISVWRFWQRGLQCRKEHKDVFVYGEYEELEGGEGGVFAYLRRGRGGGEWVVVLNFTGEGRWWGGLEGGKGVEWVAGNYFGVGGVDVAREGGVELRAWEGVLGRVV